MHVRPERIQNPHLMAARQQFAHHVLADKSGSSGQQGLHVMISGRRRMGTRLAAMRQGARTSW